MTWFKLRSTSWLTRKNGVVHVQESNPTNESCNNSNNNNFNNNNSDKPQDGETTKVQLRSKRSCGCRLCYTGYKEMLHYTIDKINFFFESLAEKVAMHPYVWIIASLTFVALSALGILRYHAINKSNILFIPANSESSKALDDSKDLFLNMRNTRHEAILLRPLVGDNVLTAECMQEGKSVFQKIISLTHYSLLCTPKPQFISKFPQYDLLHNCSVINPLELVTNDSNALFDVNQSLKSLKLMSNGNLAKHNEPAMFGKVKHLNGSITKIGILRLAFYMRETSDDSILLWEKEYIEAMRELKPKLKCISLLYYASRSVDDSIAESIVGDIFLISVAFNVMIAFATLTSAKWRNPLAGHFSLAIFGVFSTLLGIAGGFGLALIFGTPFVSIVGILPFLVLSIGIDDMFIILDEFDHLSSEHDVVKRVSSTMGRIGSTITMTTITDILAFAIGISSVFPGIRYFCIFATLTFVVEFFFQVTFFVALLTLDARRILAGRMDCLPCLHAQDRSAANKSDLTKKLMTGYAQILLTWPAKLAVIFLSCTLLAGGIYGCLNVSQEFRLADIATDDSYFKEYSKAFQLDFIQALEIHIFKVGIMDYSQKPLQAVIEKIPSIAFSTGYYLPNYSSWLYDYVAWAKATPGVNIEGSNFTASLGRFFSNPSNAHFQSSVFLNSDNQITASSVQVFMKPTSKTTVMRDAMLSLRKALQDNNVPFTPMADEFLYFEQYAAVVGEVTRNICAAAGTVLVVTLPFCVNPIIVTMLLITFLLLIVELIGLMYFWSVSINAISMIFLMMSIGFAVDYSAHVAHAFVTSTKKTTNERIVHALASIGGSVLKGGISTFLGMVVTAFASSEIFRIFFRMFLGIIVSGLFNGLALLPVLLSLSGRFLIS